MNPPNFHLETTDLETAWIHEPVISNYFLKLNQGDFSAVAQLFADQGCLCPPFQAEICGRQAIYDYLLAEGQGMTAIPKSGSIELLQDGGTTHQLAGQARTALFTVNVAWRIDLNPAKQITSVTVKLLAELPELLGFRR
ncbi:MAG: nuclear transport factor 2 family protein [Alkalinema sp. RU_4_3]|nr:nuclear transport factor 2 family protein [Alkalinema sp. RU_4_3]